MGDFLRLKTYNMDWTDDQWIKALSRTWVQIPRIMYDYRDACNPRQENHWALPVTNLDPDSMGNPVSRK